jgi:hypothetical protein
MSPVRRMVRDYGPYVIVYDADGVGAGAIGEFTRLHEWAIKHRFMDPQSMIIPFRGGKKIDDHYTTAGRHGGGGSASGSSGGTLRSR